MVHDLRGYVPSRLKRCEATDHTVSTVGKQAEVNAHTQLTFSLVPFFTKSRTPCHEDGAVHILGGSSPPQLKLSGDTL